MRTLAHSPADVIRWLLVGLGLGTDYRNVGLWPVYAAGEPPKPDNVLTVYDTVGTDDGSVMIGARGELQGHYGFMVRVRAADHPVGWAKANAIRANLAETVYDNTVVVPLLNGVAAGTYVVENCAQVGHVLALGPNVANEKTWLFTVNAVATINQTA